MKLAELACGILSTPSDFHGLEIESITDNSAKCKENSLFVCVKGLRADGHLFAASAYEKGCRAFVAEHELRLPSDACQIITSNSRQALSLLACRFFGDPSHDLCVIGITGTKGKTTTACMIAQILNQSGIPCGYIGTNGIAYGNFRKATVNTTPDPLTLQSTLKDFRNHGCRAAVIEVSSQALLQHRADGTKMSAVVFTNLSSDHIGVGEHTDFEDYKRCKKRLFTDFSASTAFVNADDPISNEILSTCTAKKRIAFAIASKADYTASDVLPLRNNNFLGNSFVLSFGEERTDFVLPLTGIGNIYNALTSAAVVQELFGISLQKSQNILENARISGRSETIVLRNGAVAVIDYAHNGIGLQQLLKDLKKTPHNRLICLFGSVGDRTQLRRHELGAVAAELCDLCILTSDNPGKEDPKKIISEIAEAFSPFPTPYLEIPDRREAILEAVRLSKNGDILVLAGKGHEEYQLIGTEKVPFSEREILMEFSALEAFAK